MFRQMSFTDWDKKNMTAEEWIKYLEKSLEDLKKAKQQFGEKEGLAAQLQEEIISQANNILEGLKKDFREGKLTKKD